ncbi:S-adenosyl-L-methionine-dependent methyltransferase [Durotheca rogersii]|uniref:S-adenosyl-L-methionine-dependent methyltransferase n=1 Tax=Durotheca rogersii TaxID=419775 RepID=UPI00221F512C|nr:S-adenosyl-L-methionine-dependent methyltransferase [Durotheca rogersii]KAI5868574.1 S-adenosyl-L-methionine-dependent methyltransferase [Durotheca rogersii]
MGRKKFRGGRKGGPNHGPRSDGPAPFQSYSEIVKKNVNMEKFYDSALPFDDDERLQFWEALKRELPNSFRFCGSKGHALAVKRLLETRYAPDIVKIERYDGEPVQAPQPVPWYPDQLAYSMNTPKHVIRKFPPFAAFQKFLVSETSVGNISRQEVVSMIPPLLMDIDPGMTVLDMCAAPGSKAAQLLEMVHAGEEARVRKVMQSFGEAGPLPATDEEDVDLAVDSGDDGRATGLLIANDADYKRSHMLVHQLKRLSSPNLLVTNHDATLYPAIRLPRDPARPEKGQYLRFDRILADVPCSGDGTLRKNVNLWKDWQPGNALGLHVTQVRILVRALQMLKVGGKVVYSTCSMNPVENEAVIVSAIERCGGPDKIGIIDCQDRLPLLKRTPGMLQWQIMDKSGRIWGSWEEVQQYALTNGGQMPGKLSETMFPRTDSSDCSALPLDRCMRVYAHQQDTGGFFIAVLEKNEEFKAKPESQSRPRAPNGIKKEELEAKVKLGEEKDLLPTAGSKRTLDDDDAETKPEIKKQRTDSLSSERPEIKLEPDIETEQATSKAEPEETKPEETRPIPNNTGQADRRAKAPDGNYEEPFKYLLPDHHVIQDIVRFYKVSPRFPSNRFMVRNATGEPAKAIYYTSSLVRDILTENEGRGVKFVHGGVKMFMKQDAPSAEVCRWRIQSEGMPMIEGYVGPERVVRLTNKATFRTLLREMFPKFVGDDWKKLGEIGERARQIGMGCCLLVVEPDGADPGFAERMVLPLWKSFHSLNLMLPKEDRSAMLLRLFNDTSPVINQTLKGAAAQKQAEAAEAAEAESEPAATATADGADEGEVQATQDVPMEDLAASEHADEPGGAPEAPDEADSGGVEEAAEPVKGAD